MLIVRRILLLIPVLLGVTLVTFFLTHVIPGNPIAQLLSPQASPVQRHALYVKFGLNKPIFVQYVDYIWQLLHGNLGSSFTTSHPVLSDLTSRFGATFELTMYAMLLALVVGIPLGILSAVRRGKIIDHVSRVLAVSGIALPVFWTSLMLLYLLYLKAHILSAPYGRIDPLIQPPEDIIGLYTVDALLTGNWSALSSSIDQLILPVCVLAFGVMAPIARITRSGMIDALESDYVRAARSLGLSARKVILGHAFRNALLPLLTMIAVLYGYLLGGVVLVENIFAWPGLGQYVYTAITSSDYPAVQGFILYATVIYVLLFLVVDLLHLAIDPRVRAARNRP
jgi:ABC-type dipeptide/oligopeptide/nickel transport system permease component